NGAAVFADDGEADAQAETGAATGAFRGEERIEQPGQSFGRNANAVVLNGDDDVSAGGPETNLDAAGFADFTNGLLRIGDEVEQDLNELVGVANHGGQIGARSEIDGHAVPAQGMLMKL